MNKNDAGTDWSIFIVWLADFHIFYSVEYILAFLFGHDAVVWCSITIGYQFSAVIKLDAEY